MTAPRWMPFGLLLLWIGSACGSDTRVDLRIEFAAPLKGADVKSIELSLVDECDGLTGGRPVKDAKRTWTLRMDQSLPSLKGIGTGRAALYARGFENDCTVIASGCEEFTVESGKTNHIKVVLASVENGPGCSAGLVCDSGVCMPPMTDGGADGGDGGADGSVPVDDCAGFGDGTACKESDTAGQCRNEACCTGCWNGTACVPGTATSACGAGGSACATCECGDDLCQAGTCVPSVPIEQVFGSADNTCAIDDGGALWCWGIADLGQLGLGAVTAPKNDCDAVRQGSHTDVACFPSPARVGLSPDGAAWTHVDFGTVHACGVDANGNLYCWGNDSFGQLGNGAAGSKNVPTAVGGTWITVATYDDHTCGIQTDTSFWCWGNNGVHEYSSSNTTSFVSPLMISGSDMATGWTEAAAGNQHVCGINLDLPWCWGGNASAQVGVPNTTATVADIAPVVGPPGEGTYAQLLAGSSYTCAVQTKNGARQGWCWGSNQFGQFGTGTTGDNAVPTVTPWGDYANGLAAGAFHGCGIESDGTLQCWGRSNFGQLGTGRLGANLADVDRGEDSGPSPATVGTAKDWIGIGLGRFHSCGIRTGGRLYCWGRNTGGQLGVGTTGVAVGEPTSAIAAPARVCITPP